MPVGAVAGQLATLAACGLCRHRSPAPPALPPAECDDVGLGPGSGGSGLYDPESGAHSPSAAAAERSPVRADYKSVLLTPSSSKRPSVSAPGSTQPRQLLAGASGDFFGEVGSPRAGDMTPGRLQAYEVRGSHAPGPAPGLGGSPRAGCMTPPAAWSQAGPVLRTAHPFLPCCRRRAQGRRGCRGRGSRARRRGPSRRCRASRRGACPAAACQRATTARQARASCARARSGSR